MLPEYFIQAIEKQYGAEESARILAGMAGPRRVTLRANRLKSTPEAVADMLKDQGIAFERLPWSQDAFLLPEASERELWRLPAYERGEIYLQSLSSMLPSIALAPEPGRDILDMAAAPGGKTAQMAAMTANRAQITACEMNKIRAEKLRYNLEKQGASRVNVMVRDARKLEDFFRFDQILLDAPCSGSGTMLESDPGSCRAFSEKLVHNSAAVQLQLLRKALSLLKPGHSLVYSTCSILAEENENIVRAALKGAPAAVEPIAFPGMEALPLLPCALPGALCVCPTAEYEGFFTVRLRKG
ncbi:MAG: RsmB/NOP family class I SAM-dependent RNA methyltransferase [Clostridia bacterium]|nr:RsmB/NOP family class I SAM-dependent RNA methyltransferase [Clostridia bacterium]